jgi:hypothetical protein
MIRKRSRAFSRAQKYVWAARNLTDFQGYDPDSAAKVKALAAKLEQWGKLTTTQ